MIKLGFPMEDYKVLIRTGFRRVSDNEIEPINWMDFQFLRMAQGALFRNTILPSGFKTPDVDMIADGGVLKMVISQEQVQTWKN